MMAKARLAGLSKGYSAVRCPLTHNNNNISKALEVYVLNRTYVPKIVTQLDAAL